MSAAVRHWIVVACAEHIARGRAGGFVPFRRDAAFVAARPAPIRRLLAGLAFALPRSNWGARFRDRLFEIADADLRCIATAMHAKTGAHQFAQ